MAAACALALALVGAAPPSALAAAPSPKASVDRAESFTFAFKDADIGQVAEEILGGALGISYTIDPGVTGKMSFRIDRRLTRAQLLDAFEAALGANDVVLVRKGESLVLTPRASAKTTAGLRPATEGIGRAGYQVVAAPLSYAQPSEVAKAFEAMGQGALVIYTNDRIGLLLLGGDGRDLEAALQTAHVFDHSGLEGAKIRWIELNQAPAQTVATELDRLLQASGTGGVTVLPLKRLNGLFVLARTPQALDEVSGWVARLDRPSPERTSSLWVYRPRSVSAEALGRTLNSVLAGQAETDRSSVTASGKTPATTGHPESMVQAEASSFATTDEDPVRVGVDKDSNTLVVSASPSRWVQIQRALMAIDRPPSQVLIEASVLEVTLSDEFRLGVDWSALAASGKLSVSSIGNPSGVVAPVFPGFSLTFLDSDIKAAVNALGARTSVEVVSAPKVVALENRTAHLQVGDQVPIVTQTGQNTTAPGSPIVSTVDYRSTGVILNVTPRISGEDKIMIDVAQEVSSVAQTTTSGIDSPTIQQRKLESTLVLKDGGVVALGGLIGTTKNYSDAGTPLLKDIPGLGALFKTQKRNGRRTELIVLLSAKIMKDDSSTDRVMTDLMSDMQEIQSRGLVARGR
jgi:general secretion pathway protein D